MSKNQIEVQVKKTKNRMKKFIVWLFKDFLYHLYDMAENKFTLHQVAPNLGEACQFGALGNSGVTGSAGAGTIVTGDVGSSPTATITNFPPSTVVPPFVVHLTNDATVQQAHADAIAAYAFLVAQGPGTVLPAQLSGQVLTSGVYSFTGGAADLAASGTLTLNGAGVFVFIVDSALTANVLSNFAGTASPCSIYWAVGTSATLNGIDFWGTVIADANITIGSGSDITGRVLAGTGPTGAVTMAGAGGNTIGGCSDNCSAAPTPPQKKSKGVGAVFRPQQFCIPPDPNNPDYCPPTRMQFRGTRGNYVLIGKDEKGNCCYRRIR